MLRATSKLQSMHLLCCFASAACCCQSVSTINHLSISMKRFACAGCVLRTCSKDYSLCIVDNQCHRLCCTGRHGGSIDCCMWCTHIASLTPGVSCDIGESNVCGARTHTGAASCDACIPVCRRRCEQLILHAMPHVGLQCCIGLRLNPFWFRLLLGRAQCTHSMDGQID